MYCGTFQGGKREREQAEVGEPSDHSAGRTWSEEKEGRKSGRHVLACRRLRVLPPGCSGVFEPMLSIRGVLRLAETGLPQCGCCAQLLAGRAQGKPMEMATEGVQGAGGPL